MTINQLQEYLISEIQEITKSLNLLDESKKEAILKGYIQAIPVLPVMSDLSFEEESESLSDNKLFPYFVVRVGDVGYHRGDTGEDNQAHVMLVFAIYDDSPDMKGYFSLVAAIESVIKRFQTNQVLGPFYCERSMEAAFQEDDTFPYFFGGIEMVWNLPDLETEELR